MNKKHLLLTNMNKIVIGLFFLFLTTACQRKENKIIPASNKNIVYQGRIATMPQDVIVYWPGSSAKIFTKGKGSVYAVLKDETGENYYNIIIDNDSIRLLHPDTIKKQYLLARFSGGKHTIELFKRTEWDKGSTIFYGFLLKGKITLRVPPKTNPLKLEFYGNSITAGYAVDDDPSHSHPDSIYTNNYDSYASLTARYFHADYRCICKSGIGIMISWFPLTMPALYNRLNPEDSLSRWDFSKYKPDIVVINLLQNDSWLIKKPDFIEFKKKFGTHPPTKQYIIRAYRNFVSTIRNHYPKAKIICMLGNMDITRKGSPWPEYVQTAVDSLHDKNIYTLFVPYKKTPGHPGRKEQKILADSLINTIRKIRKE